MVLDRAIRNQGDSGSIYDNRDILILLFMWYNSGKKMEIEEEK